VMAVIGILAALLVPSFGNVRSMGKQWLCAKKLSTLGTAYYSHRADESLRRGSVVPLDKDTWPSELLLYLDCVRDSLLCSESTFVKLAGVENIKIAVGGDPASGNTSFYMNIFGFGDQNAPWNTKDRPGPGDVAWKMNEEQFQVWSSHQGERKQVWDYMPRYTPGRNPNVYYIVLEDWRNSDGSPVAQCDYDYDLSLRVAENPLGGVSISVAATNFTGFKYGITDPTGKVIGRIDAKTTDPFNFGQVAVSYGITSYVSTMPNAAHRILMLDYPKEVAKVDDASPDNWSTSDFVDKGALKFARHLGRCNVLLADQSVRPVDPLEINPSLQINRDTYWKPGN